MDFLNSMHSYFQGERHQALFFIIPTGIALIIVAIAVYKTQNIGFGLGLGIPILLLGMASLFSGINAAIRTVKQSEQIVNEYEQNSNEVIEKEMVRMQKFNKSIKTMVYVFGGAALFGLVLFFGIKSDWARGLGIALIVFAAIGFIIDGGFAKNRAAKYTEVLLHVQKS